MFDAKKINEITQKLSEQLPENLKILQEDFKTNLKSGIQHALDKLDVVTREEFDVQAKVLAKTRSKLESLISKIEQLEKKLNSREHKK